MNEATINDLEEIPGESNTFLPSFRKDSSSIEDLQFKQKQDNIGFDQEVPSRDNEGNRNTESSNVKSQNDRHFTETRSAPGSSCVSPIQFDDSNNFHETSVVNELFESSTLAVNDVNQPRNSVLNLLSNSDRENDVFQKSSSRTEQNDLVNRDSPIQSTSQTRESDGGTRLKTATVEPSQVDELTEKSLPMSIKTKPKEQDDNLRSELNLE